MKNGIFLSNNCIEPKQSAQFNNSETNKNKKCATVIFFAATTIAFIPGLANAGNTFYVNGDTSAGASIKCSDTNDGLSLNTPFCTIQRAINLVTSGAGDIIQIAPTVTYYVNTIYIEKNGTSARRGDTSSTYMPFTIRGADRLNKTKIVANGVNDAIKIVNVHDIKIENLDIKAPGHNSQAPNAGIAITGTSAATIPYNITIINNEIHDSGGSGVQTESADWLTIKWNTIHDNAKDTFNNIYTSGISTFHSYDSDTYTGTKVIISGNYIYLNTNKNSTVPSCTVKVNGQDVSTSNCDSDGNGIIVDDLQRTQPYTVKFDLNKNYGGRTLIENNVIFGNGGSGVRIYKSDNVSVRSNTIYGNNLDPYAAAFHPAEVQITESKAGNIVSGNVLYAFNGALNSNGERTTLTVFNCNAPDALKYMSENVEYKQNSQFREYYDSRTGSACTAPVRHNYSYLDPLFVNNGWDPASNSFNIGATNLRLQRTSPGGHWGVPVDYFSPLDKYEVPRYSNDVTLGATQTLAP